MPDERTVAPWFSAVCPDRSFVDVGGLWGIDGERISWASTAGASLLTMVDHLHLGEQLWLTFVNRMAEKGINKVRTLSLDVNDEHFAYSTGKHDVVYCCGLLYHQADPHRFLRHLWNITKHHLILGTVILPGSFGDGSLYVPALTAEGRERLAKLMAFPQHAPAVGITEPVEWWNTDDCRPYWWLHSPAVVASMLRTLPNLVILDSFFWWDGRAVFYLCQRGDR